MSPTSLVRCLQILSLALLLALSVGGSSCAPSSVPQTSSTSLQSDDAARLARLQIELDTLRLEVARLANENAGLLRAAAEHSTAAAIAPNAQSSSPAGEHAADEIASKTNALVGVPPVQFSAASTPAVATTVYVTRSGSKYHTASCRYAGSGTPISLTEARSRYQPCKICSPPIAETNVGPSSVPSVAPAPVPSSVAPRPAISPTSSGQCIATTQKGTRCKRTASKGSAYCWQHGG